MAYNLKDVLNKDSRFVSGHRMCAGCGALLLLEWFFVL